MKSIFRTFFLNQLIGVLPVLLQILLLVLIVKKHKYARIGIIMWTTLFLLAFSVIQLVQGLLKNLEYGFSIEWLSYYLFVAVNVIVGTLVLLYTIRTTKVIIR
ncbi:hypothetical protein FFWV33_18515 [Flavobacterium faecale]|uniref:Uncharacterized protein n=1 Tax=Flavobacterium faecale TaxID=1355330 RepID=A0A2S1LHV8_9FLAO|nr:hypothetical protein FFWV33_18515 [Flavobacterium faecale]